MVVAENKPHVQAVPSMRLHPKQALAVALEGVSETLFGGAVGGGKSVSIIAKHLYQWKKYGKFARSLVCRKTYPELEDIIASSKEVFPAYGATYHETKHLWTFPDGAKLKFAAVDSLKDARKHAGPGFSLIAVDEVGDYEDPAIIDFLRSRLRSPNKHVRCELYLCGNPGGAGQEWLFKRFMEGRQPYVPFMATDDASGAPLGFLRCYIPSRLSDNPTLMANPQYIALLRGSGPPHLVRALLMGDWTVKQSGLYFTAKQFGRYQKLPPAKDLIHVFQSWDVAAKDKPTNDRSAVETWGVYEQGYFLLDAWAGRLELPALITFAEEYARKWNCYDVLVEDTSNGTGLIQTLRDTSNVVWRPVKPVGKKRERAWAIQPHLSSVAIPETAPWLEDWLNEHTLFDGLERSKDDWVDSTTQALSYASKHFPRGRALEVYGEALAEAAQATKKPVEAPNSGLYSRANSSVDNNSIW